ncbi:hypothetical protein DER46DRAFT_676115 [Fusarium sp. MPI-SDFR-AT-0072]|nr:hypothetical protein DER46DRAFT_676115 [Fusarium sp. MPI-SDFR-AT-0072]
MVRSVEHHGTDSMAMRKVSAEWLLGHCTHKSRAGRVKHSQKAALWMIKDKEMLASFTSHGSAHPSSCASSAMVRSPVVSLDIDRPSLTRVSSNRADPSRPSSLPIQIVGGTHGYPIDIRLFRAQDYNDDINRDHALMYDIFLLDTFS